MAAVAVVALIAGASLVAAQDDETVNSTGMPYIGVTYTPVDDGLQVVSVEPGSPAEEAGLMEGDIITGIDGEMLSAEAFVEVILASSAGDTVALDVLRDDETITVEVTLAERPVTSIVESIRVGAGFLGVRLSDTDAGVVVSEVLADSAAETAGLMEGDIITAIDGESIESARDLTRAIRQLDPGDGITVTVEREGETLELDVELGELATVGPISGIIRGDFGTTLDAAIVYLEDEGVWEIRELSDEGPLAEAGLQAGDIITAIDGETLEPGDLGGMMSDILSDDTVTLSVEREGEALEIEVNARDIIPLLAFQMIPGGSVTVIPGQGWTIPGPRGFGFGQDSGPMFGGQQARLGVTFITLDEQVAAEYGSDLTEGALITDVAENGPAAAAGLQADDVVTAVDGDVVDAERTLADRLYAYEPGDVVTLDVVRGGETIQIDVTLGQSEQSAGVWSGGFNFSTPGGRFEFNIPGLPDWSSEGWFNPDVPIPFGEGGVQVFPIPSAPIEVERIPQI
jgi:S1-C subfamily serine protease